MKNTLVREEDYESYVIPLPIRLRGARRRNYITRELEKCHPFFSERCCYDAKVRLRQGKRVATVTVMDKVRLAEYQQNGARALYVGKGERRRVFADRTRLPAYAAAPLCIAVLLGAAVIVHGARHPSKARVPAPEAAATKAVEPQVDGTQTIRWLLGQIAAGNGALERCSLEPSGFFADVSRCFPEDVCPQAAVPGVARIDTSSVTYENGEPVFSVAAPFTRAPADGQLVPAQMQAVRTAAQAHGTLQTEDAAHGTMTVAVPISRAGTFFESVTQAAEGSGAVPCGFRLEKSGGTLNAALSFAQGGTGADGSEPIGSIAGVLPELAALLASGQEKHGSAVKSGAETGLLPQAETPRAEVVGTIITKHGERIVYVRNADGKITEVRK